MEWLNIKGTEQTVLCYIIRKNEVLLMYRNKKNKDINKNKWIGIGGHIEKGENEVDAIIREVLEETGLRINKCQKRANIIFTNKNTVEFMHVFTCEDFEGKVKTTCDEGTLKWVKIKDLFTLPMWEGDSLFLKPILEGEGFFEMVLHYDGNKLVSYERLDEKEATK